MRGNTKHPCRLCMCLRKDIMNPSIDACLLRSSDVATEFLKDAWITLCKSLKHDLVTGRKLHLSANEKDILAKCKSNSVKPILPAFFDLPKPFPGFSSYSYAQPDMMHTYLHGFGEQWVVDTIICLECISTKIPYQNQYRNCLGYLDTLLSKFPTKHSLPYNLRKFKSGVTPFCVGRSSKSKKQKGDSKSSLGMIDAQDIDCLILEMLLCKQHYFKHVIDIIYNMLLTLFITCY